MTAQLNQCPKCGDPIQAEAPEGLCPKCLLAEVSLPTETGQAGRAKSDPPTVEHLAVAFPQLEIIELIGQGGMGFVFKARQPKIDRLVALKILPQSLAADPAFAERFTREGRMLARLSHPNIVAIHDFGQANGFFYLLMEFVDGVNLRQAMHAGRFTPAQALGIVPRICDALQYAHNEGILHRDIKPENILLDTKGRVKVVDFGIAKLVSEAQAETALTGSGTVLGTPQYMAPEQIEKPTEVDHRADIYSLGVVFYELLTGELPLGRFGPPSEKTDVGARVDEIVMRALHKERELRQQSATDFKTQVETVAANQASEPARAPEPYRRTPATLLVPTVNPWPRRVFWLILALVGIPVGLMALYALLPLLLGHRPAGGSYVSVANASNTVNAGHEVNAPTVKTIVLTGATNQLVGTTDKSSVGIGTDAAILPGETLRALIQHPDGRMEDAITSFSISRRLNSVQTSSRLSWIMPDSFGQAGAEAAVTELLRTKCERPINLASGQPLALFSVTNQFGAVVTGLVEFRRSLPEASEPGANVQASVRLKPYSAGNFLLFFEADVPSGYSLQATARGSAPDSKIEAHTHVSHSMYPTHYHSSWYPPASFGSEQREAAHAQLQELAGHGAIQVRLGEPRQLFSITNETGAVVQGFFELVGPPASNNL